MFRFDDDEDDTWAILPRRDIPPISGRRCFDKSSDPLRTRKKKKKASAVIPVKDKHCMGSKKKYP